MLKIIYKLSIILIVLTVSLQAGLSENQKISTSMEILKSSHIKIPQNILKNAKAIAIIPNLKRGGLLFGGSYGSGILSIKQPDGIWSDPSFITFRNASFGLQAGVESTDAIIIFETRRSLDGIADGKVTISFNAGIAAVKNGQYMSRKTDANLAADIYVYGKSSGIFVGLMSIGSGNLYINDESNDEYYDTLVNTESLLSGYLQSKKQQVVNFQKLLLKYTR